MLLHSAADGLQLRVREIQLGSQQRKPLLDLLDASTRSALANTDCSAFCATNVHSPMHPLQCPYVPDNAVVRIVTAEHLIEQAYCRRARKVENRLLGPTNNFRPFISETCVHTHPILLNRVSGCPHNCAMSRQ